MPRPAYDLILGCRYVFLGTPMSPIVVGAVQTRFQASTDDRPTPPLNPLPQQMKDSQKSDPSLAGCFKKIPSAHSPPQQGDFFTKGGLLYRQSAKDHKQLVVPNAFREQVLEMGHAIPFSGHMGAGATSQRISAHYYWPGVNEEVKRFVRSCPQCQKISTRKYSVPVTLGEMPVTGTPFQRVATDIVGPLPLSKKRNRFILTLVDTCTMWSEAVPLPTIDAKRVADALVSIFSRLGFPEQILTDNGSQFTGKLMQEVFSLIRTQHIRTSPYHPQSNGQVERFNGTLISILRKLVEDNPVAWDTYIPAALFAYREVPHASTGLSPATLLFGRPIAGPLEALKKSWTDETIDESVRTASQYVQDLRTRLKTSWAVASQTLKRARAKQSRYYNRHAKDRELQVGDKALLLLPTGSNKLQLSWQGPYPITEKLSRTNYRITIKGKDKTYHINLLKKFHERPQLTQLMTIAIAEDVAATQDMSSEYPLTPTETVTDVTLNPNLTPVQRTDMTTLLSRYPETLTDRPGRTDLVQVNFTLTDSSPIRSKPYPVPLAKETVIDQEIQGLLRDGIISPSVSPYSAPVVLLRKPSGEHRLCVDYRKLNAVVEFQAEPLPNLPQMFAKLSDARYFSKVDLTKGYYQIPVPEKLRPYLAFSTTKGHYEFNVLPFGLNNAPSIFSRMMSALLGPLKHPHIHHFMDDILIATPTWEEHLQTTHALLQRLQATGLTARPSKCLIGYEELEFLGHTLRHGFLLPEDKNIDKMKQAPHPRTKKDVRSFLGLCGFYQKFIPRFNAIASPLTDLTKKAAPEKLDWTPACESAFQELKDRLTSQPILKLPRVEQPFTLRTDASKAGLGAALLQATNDHPPQLFPVAYASRKLSQAERNYATVEQECLALIWGIQKFQLYLYGRHFTVQCDHQPLQFLASSQNLNARLMRWALLLQPYSFQVQHIAGKSNNIADFLSRHPIPDSQSTKPCTLRADAPAFTPVTPSKN